MKAKLGHYVQWLREGFLQMLRLHPVEAGLIALGCIGCLVAYETDSDDTLVRLALVPLAFAVALACCSVAVPCATSGSSTTSWCGCVRASSLRSSPM